MRADGGSGREPVASRSRRRFDRDRVVASVAVSITSLFGAGSILVGLHLTGLAMDLSAPPLAAPGAPVLGLPVGSCEGCDGSTSSVNADAARPPHSVGNMPRAKAPALASAHLSTATISPVAVPALRRTGPAVPPGAGSVPPAAVTASPFPAGPGDGHVQNATVVNLAPVAAVTAGPSGIEVNVLGDTTEGVAKVAVGCGIAASPGVGIALVSGATTCASAPAPTATTRSATPAAAPSAAPAGLLSGLLGMAAAPGGGYTVALLPGLSGSLLSATLCTAVPGVVLTLGGMVGGCAAPAPTPPVDQSAG